MKNNTIHILLLSVIISIAAGSCSKKGVSDADTAMQPVVTLHDETLYRSELDAALPTGVTGQDSLAVSEAYINMWISERLMYEKAQDNIMDKELIDGLVTGYRKVLITSLYQEQLIKERLNKSVSKNELKEYYERNKAMFKLDGAIIKGLYLKVPVESPQLANFRKWYKQGTDDATENIEKNALQNALSYEYFYDKWVSFDDVMDNIPYLITNSDQFLRGNKSIDASDSTFVYLLNIKEYKLMGDDAPYEYIAGRIGDIYKEEKRKEYLEQIQTDLYNKAVSDGDIKFYNK